jgi:hypothetical protein
MIPAISRAFLFPLHGIYLASLESHLSQVTRFYRMFPWTKIQRTTYSLISDPTHYVYTVATANGLLLVASIP